MHGGSDNLFRSPPAVPSPQLETIEGLGTVVRGAIEAAAAGADRRGVLAGGEARLAGARLATRDSVRAMSTRCAVCGVEAETRRVRFRQNAGVLIRRIVRRVEGDLCGRCAQETYVRMNTVNWMVGWAGVISLFVGPYYLVSNWRQFRRVRALAPPLPVEERKQLKRAATGAALEDILGLFGGSRGRGAAKALVERAEQSRIRRDGR
jgi:hypothetical protein